MENSETYPNAQDAPWAGSEAASEAREKIAEVGAQAREKVGELGRTAVEKLEQGRQAAAGTLHSTAASIRTGAQSSTQGITDVANKTADTMEQTAQYLREHDVRGMLGDMKQVVRRNPGPSLIAAAAVGFLLGSALRRD
jgi:ElaB/YqjD/DUF883 family membrane-anchored ribosome-binding protein